MENETLKILASLANELDELGAINAANTVEELMVKFAMFPTREAWVENYLLVDGGGSGFFSLSESYPYFYYVEFKQKTQKCYWV